MSLVLYDTEAVDSEEAEQISRELVLRPDDDSIYNDTNMLVRDANHNVGDFGEDPEFRIVLNNVDQRMLVLQNRITKELQLVDRDAYKNSLISGTLSKTKSRNELKIKEQFDTNSTSTAIQISNKVFKCPHCGTDLVKSSNGSQMPQHSGSNTVNEDIDGSFIHHSYFKLLESNIESRLPNSVFSQGYYSHFFKEMKLLGRGSRGSVYLVQHMLNDFEMGKFALKKITIGDDPKWLLNVLNEVHMLVNISVNNVNLVSYNHVWLEVDSINEFGPKVPCAFILQQYCSGGNLEDFIDWLKSPKLSLKQMKQYKIRKLKGRLLTEEEILIMFKDIVNGVHELHKHHIIHRDLKPSNCLLSEEYVFPNFPNIEPILENIPKILIGDFGESQLEGEKRSASGSTGTLEYCAPELFQLNQFNKKTDIYSLGMILFHMCFGELPFKSTSFDVNGLRNEVGDFENILKRRYKDKRDLLDGFSLLIQDMTHKDPSKRIHTGEILQRINDLNIEIIENKQGKGKRLSISDEDSEQYQAQDDESHEKDHWFQRRSHWIMIRAAQVLLLSLVLRQSTSELLKYLIVFINGLVWFDKRHNVSTMVLLSMVALYIYGFITTHPNNE